MSGARHRQKGNRAEREIVDLHKGINIHAERYPLSGDGFTQLEKWLAEFDALFLRRNHSTPLVVLPWRTWTAMLAKVRQ
jgi:hypothetical protein